ncbi:MAG: succinate dehydrogenase [Candidatus Parvarchaeota archaeon]|nr:succinate dehydrogenase [Candidatus Parvarchaeum tengchongense]MCW1298946.1 succinate dehydrogenase [Candidatus Parvarchaeum tengchongense]MCW1312016.1 succinate dehydrogenase [Candidatus Parvarchaeum tengchongense]
MDSEANFFSTMKKAIPELLEPNWRLWSFLAILLFAIVALFVFPVKEYKGLIDPFYSPTILVVPVVGLFRLTCYAYRKDYYRNIFNHPQSCAADERGDSASRGYSGETTLFAFNNLHRYLLYIGIILLPFFYYDFYVSVTYFGGFVLRFASLLILTNAILLTLWVFSCHAFRHVFAGGNVKCYDCALNPKARKGFFNVQSMLNKHHEEWAFISLVFIVLVDLYLRALAAGWPVDFRILQVV